MGRITCLECGQRNDESTRFCVSCGAMLMPSDGSRPPETAPPPAFEIASKPWLSADPNDSGESSTRESTAAGIQRMPPPTDISVPRVDPDQWTCILCETANAKERTFCSYCGNRRGATADETGMLPKPTGVEATVAPVTVAAGQLWRAVGQRVRTAKRPTTPTLRVDPRVIVALIAAIVLVLVATHLPTGGPAPTPPPQAVTPPTVTPPTIAPPPATRDTLTATTGPDSAIDQLGPGDDRLVSEFGHYTLLLSGGDLSILGPAQRVVWRAGVKGADHVDMQWDGNFVIYPKKGPALWATGVQKIHGPYQIQMQDDGNLVLHPLNPTDKKAVWASWNDAGCLGSLCQDCIHNKAACPKSVGPAALTDEIVDLRTLAGPRPLTAHTGT